MRSVSSPVLVLCPWGMCNSFLWASELVLAGNMWMQGKKRKTQLLVFTCVSISWDQYLDASILS